MSFQSLIESVGRVMSLLVPLSVAVALLFFLWGMATFILASGDTKKIQEGKDKIKWGLIALFIMVSIWGIVRVMRQDFLGLNSYDSDGTIPVNSRDTGPENTGPEEERFLHGLTNEGYFDDGTPCPEYLFGTPSCAYDRNGTYQGQWAP